MIALATADLTAFSYEDLDMPILLEAFAGRVDVEPVIWDDDGVDWSAYELVVLRSTWDYSYRLAEFGRWIRHVDFVSRLLNPVRTIDWNLDKRYLAALEAGGVPVVRTGYVTGLADFDAELATVDAAQIVVKPTVSAGSDLTGRFERADPAARELAAQILERGKQVMLQPYYASVTRQGELAVIHIDGVFSHALRKGPLLDVGGGLLGGEYTEVLDAVRPSDAELVAADQALERYRELVAGDPAPAGTEPLLYSRVDLIEGDDGQPCCLELELIEPSLFFETDDKAAGRFVDAVVNRLGA